MAKSSRNSRKIPRSKSVATTSNSAKSPRIGSTADSGNSDQPVPKKGSLITFSPTGERIRITRIGRERITLDKSP